MNETTTIAFSDFTRVDMRVGTIISATKNINARVPAYVLSIDFGDLGIKQSSAQITAAYSIDDLPGRQIIAVVNFEPKRVAGIKSEVLVLAVVESPDRVILIGPSTLVENGTRIL